MQISFVAPSNIAPGAWVVGAAEGTALLPAAVRADKASGGALTRALKISRFTGKSGQMLEVLAPAGIAASRLLLVGLGKPESLDERGWRLWARRSSGGCMRGGETSASLEIEVPKGAKVKKAEAAAHLAFGAKLKSYAFDKYRTRNSGGLSKRNSTSAAHRHARQCGGEEGACGIGGGGGGNFPGPRSGERAAQCFVSSGVRAPRQTGAVQAWREGRDSGRSRNEEAGLRCLARCGPGQ